GLAGAGEGHARRRALLSDAGIEPVPVSPSGVLPRLDVLFIAGLDAAAAKSGPAAARMAGRPLWPRMDLPHGGCPLRPRRLARRWPGARRSFPPHARARCRQGVARMSVTVIDRSRAPRAFDLAGSETADPLVVAKLAQLQDASRGRDARGVLELALQGEFKGKSAVVSSFGAESAVLLHLVAEIDPATPILFLNTGKLFGETLRYRDRL